MPQASAAQRRRWGIGAEKAIKFLQRHGYVLTKDHCWVVPKDHTPTEQERSAAGFLCDEWDFGGFLVGASAPQAPSALRCACGAWLGTLYASTTGMVAGFETTQLLERHAPEGCYRYEYTAPKKVPLATPAPSAPAPKWRSK